MTCYNDIAFLEHLVTNILLEELAINPDRCLALQPPSLVVVFVHKYHNELYKQDIFI